MNGRCAQLPLTHRFIPVTHPPTPTRLTNRFIPPPATRLTNRFIPPPATRLTNRFIPPPATRLTNRFIPPPAFTASAPTTEHTHSPSPISHQRRRATR